MYNRWLFRILNLQTASVVGGLDQAVRAAIGKQTGAAWIGHAVAKIPGGDESCRWSGDGRGCGLEGNRRRSVQASRSGPVLLEGPTQVAVLLRDCPIDAGGLTLHWLTSVKPAESVAMLWRLAAASRLSSGSPIRADGPATRPRHARREKILPAKCASTRCLPSRKVRIRKPSE